MIKTNKDENLYFVVVNEEGQYSIWPSNKTAPAGWETQGEPQSKADCLAYIESVWTDMRPSSTRTRQVGRAAAAMPSSGDGAR